MNMQKHFVTFLVCALFACGVLEAQLVNPLTYTDPDYGWFDNRDPDSPRQSSNAVTGLQLGSIRVMVAYGSPSAKDRKIFGALVPFGQVWRTGADEATTLTTNGPIVLAGQRIEAGTYSLFTRPGKERWQLILNTEHNLWGTNGRKAENDLLEVELPSSRGDYRERLVFWFDTVRPSVASAELVLAWERIVLRIPMAEAD